MKDYPAISDRMDGRQRNRIDEATLAMCKIKAQDAITLAQLGRFYPGFVFVIIDNPTQSIIYDCFDLTQGEPAMRWDGETLSKLVIGPFMRNDDAIALESCIGSDNCHVTTL